MNFGWLDAATIMHEFGWEVKEVKEVAGGKRYDTLNGEPNTGHPLVALHQIDIRWFSSEYIQNYYPIPEVSYI